MKKTLQATPPLLAAFWVCIAAGPVPAPGFENKIHVEHIEKPGEKKPVKKLKSSSLNNAAVKIYPDAWKRLMHVVAKEGNSREIDFYVFDMQGSLVKHFKIKPGGHERISGLPKGVYNFSVFAGDAETASGKFEIR